MREGKELSYSNHFIKAKFGNKNKKGQLLLLLITHLMFAYDKIISNTKEQNMQLIMYFFFKYPETFSVKIFLCKVRGIL